MARPSQLLRDELDRAVRQNRPADALRVCTELERVEPREPRWPHRRGDLLRRAGRRAEAVIAYTRATEIYSELGFVARAVAMANVVLELDPNATDLLERVDTRSARQMLREQRRSFVTGIPSIAPPPPEDGSDLDLEELPSTPSIPPPPPPEALGRGTAEGDDLDSFGPISPEDTQPPARRSPIGPTPPMRADTLLPAAPDGSSSAGPRFADGRPIDLDLSELEVLPRPVPSTPPSDDDVLLTPRALAELPAVPLLADVPRSALLELGRESDVLELLDGEPILRAGEPADSLYAIVEGQVVVVSASKKESVLVEGDVFGESCLLEGFVRRSHVFARGRTVVLRITRRTLQGLMLDYPRVRTVLFELLSRRIVGSLLVGSEIFGGLAPVARRHVARLFEVRRAIQGTALSVAGKRGDGLYIVLAGRVELTYPDGATSIRGPGAVIGHRSLLAQPAPSELTVTAVSDTMLLRLPTSSFARIASEHPDVPQQLSALENEVASDVVVPDQIT